MDPNWKDNDSDYERDVDDEKIKETQIFCHPCNKPILSRNLEKHEDCATHQERAKKYKKKRLKSSDNYSKYSAIQAQAPTPPKRTKKSISEPNIVPASQSNSAEMPDDTAVTDEAGNAQEPMDSNMEHSPQLLGGLCQHPEAISAPELYDDYDTEIKYVNERPTSKEVKDGNMYELHVFHNMNNYVYFYHSGSFNPVDSCMVQNLNIMHIPDQYLVDLPPGLRLEINKTNGKVSEQIRTDYINRIITNITKLTR